ncbi:hypothetical protein HDU76_001037 [Blyttiomyces sp. JEL0837]|nr:hypothetical protein HDU76_001037 [Blyttiomyces sp. JEL0837]
MSSPISSIRHANLRCSKWDNLPIEIRSVILLNTDVLTRYLNDDLTTEEIQIHGNEIWKIVFENDLVDCKLSLLPQDHLPNIYNGLGLVKSKHMYHLLEELRPDLLNIDPLKGYLILQDVWNFRQKNPFISHNPTTDPQLSIISNLLFHIPLRQLWWDHFPDWWSTIDKERICTLACCFNHVELAKSLLDDITLNNKIDQFLHDMGTHCFETATAAGHIDIVRLFTSLNSLYGLPNCGNALQIACVKGRIDIALILIQSLGAHQSAFLLINILFSACKNGKVNAVSVVCDFGALLRPSWELDGMLVATRFGHSDIVKLLMTKLKSSEKPRICQIVMHVATACGNVELVEFLSVEM